MKTQSFYLVAKLSDMAERRAVFNRENCDCIVFNKKGFT